MMWFKPQIWRKVIVTSDPSFVSNLLLLRHAVLEGSTALVIARINSIYPLRS